MELRRQRAALAVLVVVALAGCSDGEDPAPAAAGGPVAREPVTFTTRDGVTLNGVLYNPPEAHGVVIMAHQQGGSMGDFTQLALEVADDRMAAFTFNFRGYGGQDGEADTSLDRDLAAAVAAMREQGFERIGLLGAGSGATAALHHAQNDDVATIMALSPAREFAGLRVQPGEIDETVLFLADEDDQPYRRDAEYLSEQMPDGHLPLTVVDGHGMQIINEAGRAEKESLMHTVRVTFAGGFFDLLQRENASEAR